MDHLRTYRVRSLHEALQLIRRELGPDAAVLHTREVRSGWLGWRMELEVTASAEVEIPSRMANVVTAPPEPTLEAATVASAERIDFRQMFQQNLEQDSAGLDLSQPTHTEFAAVADVDPFAAAKLQLEESGLPLSLLTEFQRQALDSQPTALEPWLRNRIVAELNVQGATRVPRGRRTVAAVVGPTGVGKTTTLAKLAASFRLEHHRKVGLVTVDTYRVGAVDQLRAYAEIMDLPMEVVSSPREMRDALSRLHECDVVLIDTAGRSQRDRTQMRELGALLAAACPDEVHLVASTVAETDSLQETVARFREAGANRLILTKADEATRPGRLFSFLRTTDLPLSYVTNGQNVPADIRPATGERLAEWMLVERPAQDL